MPFKKHEDFKYQQEFRIVLETVEHDDKPFTLQVGDIRDICRRFTVEEFNRVEIKLEHTD